MSKDGMREPDELFFDDRACGCLLGLAVGDALGDLHAAFASPEAAWRKVRGEGSLELWPGTSKLLNGGRKSAARPGLRDGTSDEEA